MYKREQRMKAICDCSSSLRSFDSGFASAQDDKYAALQRSPASAARFRRPLLLCPQRFHRVLLRR